MFEKIDEHEKSTDNLLEAIRGEQASMNIKMATMGTEVGGIKVAVDNHLKHHERVSIVYLSGFMTLMVAVVILMIGIAMGGE